jgi:sugar transferase (PEP-CTERM/EpsH1 system associated)
MRLLFLTPQPPFPPHQGTTIRNYNLIVGLAQRHEIDLLTFADAPLDESSPLSGLCRRIEGLPAPARSLTRRALATLLSPLPDMALRLWSPRFAARVWAWLAERQYDVIQIEGIEMARYGLLARERAGRARLVFDDHNAEWLLQQRTYQAERQLKGRSAGAVYSLIQTWKLRRFERAVCRAVDRIVAVSTSDADAIRRLDPALQVAVVTNGVDTQRYRPGVVAPFEFGAPAIVFSGTMDFRPNVDAVLWFVERVWPPVRAAVPSAQFWIVGQRPHARLDPLRGRDDVRITGAVEDVRPYILGASAYAIPLRMGGGTRLKALEAMALGAPIVSTSLGIDGFDVAHEREAVIADDPDRFAAEIVRLVGDAGWRRALGAGGRQFAAARYDWRDIAPKMEAVYE